MRSGCSIKYLRTFSCARLCTTVYNCVQVCAACPDIRVNVGHFISVSGVPLDPTYHTVPTRGLSPGLRDLVCSKEGAQAITAEAGLPSEACFGLASIMATPPDPVSLLLAAILLGTVLLGTVQAVAAAMVSASRPSLQWRRVADSAKVDAPRTPGAPAVNALRKGGRPVRQAPTQEATGGCEGSSKELEEKDGASAVEAEGAFRGPAWRRLSLANGLHAGEDMTRRMSDLSRKGTRSAACYSFRSWHHRQLGESSGAVSVGITQSRKVLTGTRFVVSLGPSLTLPRLAGIWWRFCPGLKLLF